MYIFHSVAYKYNLPVRVKNTYVCTYICLLVNIYCKKYDKKWTKRKNICKVKKNYEKMESK